MKTLQLSDSFKQMIERNKEQSKICKYLSLADKLPLTIKGSGINYLTTREGGLISYLPSGRPCRLTDEGKWSREGRQEARPSNVLAAIFSRRIYNRLESRDIEIFTNIIKGFESSAPYEIVSGYDLEEVYNERSEVHSIYNSCMQNKNYFEDGEGNEHSLVRLYADNPDRIEMLVFRNSEGKLIGRVLKWLTDCGAIVIDRVYATEEITNRVNDLCYVNGWYKREFNTFDHKERFIFQGTKITKHFSVTLNNYTTPCIPYMDTFSYMEVMGQTCRLYNQHEKGTIFNLMTSTTGNFTDVFLRYCPILQSPRNAGSFLFSDFYGLEIYKHDCYMTDKGLVYGKEIKDRNRLVHKGKTYTEWEEESYFLIPKEAKFSKLNGCKIVKRYEVERVDCYILPDGKIVDQYATRTERYKVAEVFKDGQRTGEYIEVRVL